MQYEDEEIDELRVEELGIDYHEELGAGFSLGGTLGGSVSTSGKASGSASGSASSSGDGSTSPTSSGRTALQAWASKTGGAAPSTSSLALAQRGLPLVVKAVAPTAPTVAAAPGLPPVAFTPEAAAQIRAVTPGVAQAEGDWQAALARQGYSASGCPLEHVDPFAAELKKITAQLALAQVQREATSEHLALERLTEYRRMVLRRLHALLDSRC